VSHQCGFVDLVRVDATCVWSGRHYSSTLEQIPLVRPALGTQSQPRISPSHRLSSVSSSTVPTWLTTRWCAFDILLSSRISFILDYVKFSCCSEFPRYSRNKICEDGVEQARTSVPRIHFGSSWGWFVGDLDAWWLFEAVQALPLIGIDWNALPPLPVFRWLKGKLQQTCWNDHTGLSNNNCRATFLHCAISALSPCK